MAVLTQNHITFAQFMEQSLYGPEGYYSSGRASSGRAGDYFTAPDTGPAFGRLLAEIFRAWEKLLELNHFQVLEAGAGEGALAASIRRFLPEFPYIAVERSPERRKKLAAQGFQTWPDLESGAVQPIRGCLLANELLDAFPVHRVRMKNGWLQEAYVAGNSLRWDTPSTKALVSYLDRLHVDLPDGYQTEINLAMAPWFRSAAQALEAGLVLLIDYGRPGYAYYAPERDGGTLRAFRGHQVTGEWLKTPGQVDLTADVDFTSAALDARAAGFDPLAFMELGSFLMEGAKRLPEDLRKTANPAELKGLRYLIHPDGLGSAFHVLVLGKDCELTPNDFPNNRLKRLGLEEIDAANR